MRHSLQVVQDAVGVDNFSHSVVGQTRGREGFLFFHIKFYILSSLQKDQNIFVCNGEAANRCGIDDCG